MAIKLLKMPFVDESCIWSTLANLIKLGTIYSNKKAN